MKVHGKYSPAGETEGPSSLKVTMLQVLMGLGAAISLISPGMTLGFSAVALPQLTVPSNSSLPMLDDNLSSWFASISSISTPVGCLLSGWTLDRLGRKWTLIILNVPGILGWGILAASQSLGTLFTGRLLTGFALGMATTASNVYLGEIARPNLRGMLICWNSISIALGILLAYILGSVLPWRWTAIASVLPALLSVVTAVLMPESPCWLLSKGLRERAETAMFKLRGGMNEEVRAELDGLATAHEERMRGRGNQTGFRQLSASLMKPQFWKPLLLMNVFFAFQQCAGVFVVIFYAVDVVLEAGVNMDKYLATVLIGVARFVVTCGVSWALRRYGRRPLAIMSGAGMTVCMVGLAAHLFFTANVEHVRLPWLPTAAILGYITTSTVGFLTLPWIMIGEVFPADLRGLGSGLTTCCAYLIGFAALKSYPSMRSQLEAHGTFLTYGIVALAGTIFVVLWLPETAGKTLEEMEAYFAQRPLPSKVRVVKPLLRPNSEYKEREVNLQV